MASQSHKPERNTQPQQREHAVDTKLQRMQQAARDLEQAWPAKLGRKAPATAPPKGDTSQ